MLKKIEGKRMGISTAPTVHAVRISGPPSLVTFPRGTGWQLSPRNADKSSNPGWVFVREPFGEGIESCRHPIPLPRLFPPRLNLILNFRKSPHRSRPLRNRNRASAPGFVRPRRLEIPMSFASNGRSEATAGPPRAPQAHPMRRPPRCRRNGKRFGNH